MLLSAIYLVCLVIFIIVFLKVISGKREEIKRLAEKNKVLNRFIDCGFMISGLFVTILSFIMRIFPIQENKIVCSSWKGKRCGDNPLYIAEEIIRKYPKYEIVWLLNKDFNQELPMGIRRADNTPISAIYELVTAKVWIDSNTKQLGLLKRKGQLYLQTWHGSYGIKKLYGDILEKLRFIEKVYMQYNSKIMDIMVSNSRQTSEIYHRAMWFDGKILEYGSPRNDIYFKNDNEILDKVHKYFGVENKKIVLYAPTFRNNLKVNQFDLDFYRLKKCLERRFGSEWVVMIRLHPHNLCEAKEYIEYSECIKNASEYNDMQELMVASDILITDYSSCMFDFVTTGKICFLYATDFDKYKEERDYYFDLRELPFLMAKDNDEMEKNIDLFDEIKYKEELNKLFEQVGLCETGHASEKVADYIEEWVANN